MRTFLLTICEYEHGLRSRGRWKKLKTCGLRFQVKQEFFKRLQYITAKKWEPRYKEPLYNEVPYLKPGQNCSKMYGTEPLYNDPPV